jgi:uncharacterized Fe-S cluster protein YjdI
MSREKTYTNGEVTVIWKPDTCIHSEKCWRGLPAVFKPKEKPWIQTDGAGTEAIIRQVRQCPSGALSYRMNDGHTDPAAAPAGETISVEVLPNGPLMVKGTLKVRKPNGEEETCTNRTAFCRCGASANKPFCDGSHKKVDFQG